jgi:tetratricopeptide (TPR) repeat protein
MRQSVGDDRADELRRSHDRVLREAIGVHGGREVKSTGDGLMVVFGSAGEAVAAAETMQRGVARFGRRIPAAMSIRIGISSGDVVWESDDCFGTPVIEARRLCDHAEGGQILVSEVVRLLSGSRGGHEFLAVGALQLKGIREPVPSAEVVWAAEGEASLPLPGPLATTPSVDFVGRVGEMEQLWTTWKLAQGGEQRLVLVSGEPGVGKTRLAAELAARVHADGATVLFGRCDEELAVPYQPFVEALRTYVSVCPPDDLLEQLGPDGGELVRLVPELRDRVPDLADPVNADPETERYRLFEAVATFVGAAAGSGTPLLLVLDDLHWGAKPTLLMLRHLIRTASTAPILVVGTYRDTELDRRHPLSETLADLRRDGPVERVTLHGLDEEEVTQFVGAAANQSIDTEIEQLARAVYTETEGNPFFVGQVLRHLVESGAVELHEGRWVRTERASHVGIPEGVREVITRRLTSLDDDANQVLAVASVVGRQFDTTLLAEATDLEFDTVLDALESAEQARLVESTGAHAQFTFVHALVRSTLYDEIPTTRRLRVHRRVGQALESRLAGGDETVLSSLAHHYCEAAALGESKKAIEYATGAAERALERTAYEEAAQLLERALTVLEPGSDEDRLHRGELLVAVANARWAAGDRAGARPDVDQAARHARETGRPDVLAEAALAIGGSRGWVEAGTIDEQLTTLCEEGLDLLPPGDSAHRAKLMGRLVGELYLLPEHTERRRALADQAVAMARRIDDPATLAFVLGSAHWGMWIPGNAAERLRVAEEILEIARASRDRAAEFNGAAWAFADLMELGETARAKEMVDLELEIAAQLGQPDFHWSCKVQQGALVLMEGHYDEAVRIADEALAYGQAAQTETSVQMHGVVHVEVGRARGGLEELLPLVEGMVEYYPLLPAWRCGLVYVNAMLGRLDEIGPHLELLVADEVAALPRDANWTIGIAVLIAAAAALEDAELADRLYELLLPYAEFCITAGMPALTVGSAELFLAAAAGTAGRWDVADQHFERAMERNREIGCHAWVVHGNYEYAAIVARKHDPADSERLHQMLRTVVVEGSDMGMTRVVDQARTLADELGVTLDE